MEYSSYLFDLAWKFPKAAPILWQSYKRCNEFVSSLSPDVRGRIGRCRDLAIDVVGMASRKTRSMYTTAMSLPRTPHDEWQQPSRLILSPLSRLILLWQPVVQEWEAEVGKDPSEKVVFVGNKYIYGLDLPALHSVIYLKTGKLVRFTVDPIHFQIPLWKHFLQYFGAVPLSPTVIPDLMEAGYMLVWFPDLPMSGSEPGCLTGQEMEFGMWALDHGYSVLPVATMGMADMLPIKYHIPLHPVHRAAALISAILPKFLNPIPQRLTTEAFRDSMIPIVLPRSYQRQYMRFSTPMRTTGPSRKLLEVDCIHSSRFRNSSSPLRQRPLSSTADTLITQLDIASTLASRTFRAMDMNALYLEELRLEDPRRYVLSPLYSCVHAISRAFSGVNHGVKGSERLVRRQSARALRAVAGWVDVVTKEMQSPPPPTDNPPPPPEYFPVNIKSVVSDDEAMSDGEWYDCE
ncbi:hypothetical protein PhCBS80983_g00033 [Powellomyces hirtus]|uniref:Uncharacterized protein n=1 Tax=Powellomyces hirtus TaxID=109895 RepID=A0A507EI88_9FUNG|nr:hypothetical protein PhCBS80983_g00033 [Powellomyces hirtus]